MTPPPGYGIFHKYFFFEPFPKSTVSRKLEYHFLISPQEILSCEKTLVILVKANKPFH